MLKNVWILKMQRIDRKGNTEPVINFLNWTRCNFNFTEKCCNATHKSRHSVNILNPHCYSHPFMYLCNMWENAVTVKMKSNKYFYKTLHIHDLKRLCFVFKFFSLNCAAFGTRKVKEKTEYAYNGKKFKREEMCSSQYIIILYALNAQLFSCHYRRRIMYACNNNHTPIATIWYSWLQIIWWMQKKNTVRCWVLNIYKCKYQCRKITTVFENFEL